MLEQPWYVHWKGEPGRALCLVAHEARTGQRMFTRYAMPGDLLEKEDRRKVTCPDCMEWIHG